MCNTGQSWGGGVYPDMGVNPLRYSNQNVPYMGKIMVYSNIHIDVITMEFEIIKRSCFWEFAMQRNKFGDVFTKLDDYNAENRLLSQ